MDLYYYIEFDYLYTVNQVKYSFFNEQEILSAWVNHIGEAFGEVLHFNGLSWYRDSQIYSVFGDNFVFKGSDLNDHNLAVVGRLVGWVHGIVVRGYRIQ